MKHEPGKPAPKAGPEMHPARSSMPSSRATAIEHRAPPDLKARPSTAPMTADGQAKPMSFLDRPLLATIPLTGESIFYAVLVALAAIMRFWDLGSRALHHDESLHALYAWYLYTGRGYAHDPMMHGPFLFHATALLYFLFGANDYTARVLEATLGTILVTLPIFFRAYLGRIGAMVVAFMLAFSPSLLYYSRFARNDIMIAAFTLGLVICLFRYIRDGDGTSHRERYLLIAAGLLSLSFATKEVTFITVAIFGSFLALWTAPEWLQILRRRHSLARLSAPASFLLLLATLAAPQFSAASKLLVSPLAINVAAPVSLGPLRLTTGDLLGGVVVGGLIAISAAIGLSWNRSVWLRAAVIFYAIYIVLYTTVFTNPPGFVSGIWGSLSYWLDQHDVERGNQPSYYYFVLLPIYEFLPIFFGIIGAVTALTRRRTAFNLFLVWWLTMALLAYSVAGEKMPWLVVHITLPLVVLAGTCIGSWLGTIGWAGLKRQRALWLVLLLPLFVLALIGFRKAALASASPPQLIFLGLVVAVLIAAISQLGARLNRRQILDVAGLTIGLIMLAFTIRAGWIATYQHGDIPVEMLVYTQTSPDVPKIFRDIEELGRRTGEGKNLKITVDSTESFTWPWAWYLRDYKNVDYPSLSTMTGPPTGDVLLLHASNEARAKPFLGKYGPGQRYRLRWWFPEDYRGLTWGSFLGMLVDPAAWDRWWQYFLFRTTANPLGSSDGIVYFPKQSGVMTVGLPQQPTPAVDLSAKVITIQPLRVIGRPGSGSGEFNSPKALTFDAAGNLYVLDSQNGRIEKFDASGKLLAMWGSAGSGPGQFDPSYGGAWGIAVDAQGFIYAVDTWNHRIQKLDPTGKVVATWGGGLTDNRGQRQGNEGKFYGPRGIAIDRAGNLYIADTGNARIQKLAPDGTVLAVIGGRGSGPGEFNEPTDVAIDARGNLYVADAWNHRIQVFDQQLAFVREIPVPGWESDSLLNKPGIAVDAAGTILAADPEGHRIFRFNPSGQLIAILGTAGAEPGQFNLPMDIAIDRAGNIAVVEAGNNRVQIFAALP